MPVVPTAVEKLVTQLARLPGIGERMAARLVFHILSEPETYARQLARSFEDLIEHVRFCSDCHMVCDGEFCGICRNGSRERDVICVVERVQDLLAFERTNAYRGLYHVLHGVLAPIKGVGPDKLHLPSLLTRIERDEVQEVILATSTDVEGEATALYLARYLASTSVTLSRIATGVPLGGELEYIDPNTLTRALDGRTVMG
jgi:recombination protein RecR